MDGGTVSQIKITNSRRTKIHLLCSQISQKPWGFGKDLQKNVFFYALPNTQFSAYFCGISYEWNLGSLFSNSWISKFEMQNCSLSRNCSHTWHLPHSSENLFVCWFFMKDVCWFYDQDLHPGTLQYSALWKCTRWKLLLQRSRWWTGASEEGEMRKAEMFQLRKTLAIASGTTLSPMYVPTTTGLLFRGSGRGNPWKRFTTEKYSPLKNISPWKIFTTENIHPC